MERTWSMNSLTDQKKGSLMAFVAVMFITPDSLFIRLSNVETWSLVFYRGIIPFVLVFAGIDLIDQKLNGDINVTSPTGIKTYYDLSGKNLAKTFWKELKA